MKTIKLLKFTIVALVATILMVSCEQQSAQLIVEGNIVDHHNREIFEGSVVIEDGKIAEIKRHETDNEQYIMVGFVDSHVHIESSMLTPQNFGELAIARGTVAVVTDPHEIGNVLGLEGIDIMLGNSQASPIKTYFSMPSCVPSTPFDVSGAIITAKDIETLAATGNFVALSEVMNVPGVLTKDPEVMGKLNAAKQNNLPIDGHAPLLSGADLNAYVANGITTDHEASNLNEAVEKINAGMKILIREGSAARNYDALKSCIKDHNSMVMFCTDDSHPDEIIEFGHIDKIVKRAIADGYNIFDILNAASTNAINHYKLPVGQLRVGETADFIVVDNLTNLTVKQVYINGEKRFDGKVLNSLQADNIAANNFNLDPISIQDLNLKLKTVDNPVIGIVPNELITTLEHYTPSSPADNFESDTDEDIVKIVFINRYTNGTPQVALCRGTGFKQGAIASSVSHDTHNIIAVGTNDKDLMAAINKLIENKGGLSVSHGDKSHILPLPIAGIMTNQKGDIVAKEYKKLHEHTAEMGCTLKAPFMTLSFLSLVVIPEIKIGEEGLFQYSTFSWME